jgi:Periplasmic protein TonB, links inner and outer membranes
MKTVLAALVFVLSAGIATAQAPAPFNMNPEGGSNASPAVQPPVAAQPERPAAPSNPAPPPATPAPAPVLPQLTQPSPQPVPPTTPAQQDAPRQADQPKPEEVEAAKTAAGRRYLVPEKSLRLSGESARRSWSVYLTPEQAASPAKLHLGYQNAIVVAPEISRLNVTINDVPILDNPIAFTDQVGDQVVTVPAGTLKAGANTIQLRADQRHRTDCTIESTFELWTDIDPTRTYLSFEAPDMRRFSRLDDIRALGVDPTGNTRFRLIVPALDQLGSTDVLMRLAQGLALMGNMPNQSFIFEKAPSTLPQPGELPIFVGTHDELQGLLPALTSAAANAAVASFLDYPGSDGSSALILSGPTWPALEGLVDSFVASTNGSTTQRRDTLATQSWRGVETPFLFSKAQLDFSQLGIESQEFGGRLFRTSFTIGVPADFYATAYGEARILLDAAYSGAVEPGSHIDVIVNGNLASTVPVTSSGGAVLRHLPIKLTLRHFKPGVNTMTIEASLRTEQDQVCAPGATADNKPRFALFGTSQFRMPDFARIAQVPNLAATAGTGFPYRTSPNPVSLFLGRIEENSLSAAATFLGKMAVASHHVIPVDVTISAARIAGSDAIFVGAVSEMPTNILTQLNIDQESRSSWSPAGTPTTTSSGSSVTLQDWQQLTGGNFFRRQFEALSDWVKENFDLSLSMLRFAPEADEAYKPSKDAKMIIAQESDPTDVGTWTALIAPDSTSLAEGMQALSSRQEWDKLAGRIIAYAGPDKEPETVAVSRFRFMPTQPMSFENIRLIAANWLSDNIMSYALLLGAGGILLGLATYGLLTLLGRRYED